MKDEDGVRRTAFAVVELPAEREIVELQLRKNLPAREPEVVSDGIARHGRGRDDLGAGGEGHAQRENAGGRKRLHGRIRPQLGPSGTIAAPPQPSTRPSRSPPGPLSSSPSSRAGPCSTGSSGRRCAP